MKKVLAVADDITGADDVGLMYRKSGHPAVLYPFPFWQQAGFAGGEKLVVDTDSRFLPPEEAYNRVFRVVKKFSSQGVQQYINKQCSVFRGNIGPEFDAMLDALGLNFAPVVLGFPDNGRTTLDGIHYVYGEKLEDSQFRNDPVNPMRESNLVKILAGQTRRPVTNVSWREYAEGRRLRSLIEQRRREGGYVIFDVRHNADLAMLAGLLKDEPVVCGSSAIAYYLGMEEGPGTLPPAGPAGGKNARVLCLAGSLTPQTRQQVKCAQQKGERRKRCALRQHMRRQAHRRWLLFSRTRHRRQLCRQSRRQQRPVSHRSRPPRQCRMRLLQRRKKCQARTVSPASLCAGAILLPRSADGLASPACGWAKK